MQNDMRQTSVGAKGRLQGCLVNLLRLCKAVTPYPIPTRVAVLYTVYVIDERSQEKKFGVAQYIALGNEPQYLGDCMGYKKNFLEIKSANMS